MQTEQTVHVKFGKDR